jgi:hypothetical protein
MRKMTDSPDADGLVLIGVAQARRRREVKGRDGRVRFCITLFVRASAQVYRCDRWSDAAVPDGTPDIGQHVELPVRAEAYTSHGTAMSRLAWGADSGAGLSF